MYIRALALLAPVFLFSNTAFAATLDKNIIKGVHEKVKSAFIEKCKTEMTGATDSSCKCLGEKAQSFLDDAELAKCTTDAKGGPCITKIISNAALKATTQESIALCMAPQSQQPINNTSSTADQTNQPPLTSATQPNNPSTAISNSPDTTAINNDKTPG